MRSRENLRLLYFIHLSLQAVSWTHADSDPGLVVTQGDRAVLPCEFQKFNDSSRLYIVWTFNPRRMDTDPFQVILFQDGRVRRTAWNLGRRVSFLNNPLQSGTISIEGTHSADAGLYQCLVVNPILNHLSLIRLINVTVLEPPSTPTCSAEGELELGSEITLTCRSFTGDPQPRYSWWKQDPKGNIPLHLLQKDGIVVLHNVTEETSGRYVCVSSNSLGSESCFILLQLLIFQQEENTLAVGVTVATTMAVILLTLLSLLLCLHRENRIRQSRSLPENQVTCVPVVDDAPPSQTALTEQTL
ncbi:immunoglobulin superfamily member 11-like isoform X2 [Stegostoma tigrinum]|uniref:immunoglobulin superfamily member 11-like isoform X2 n=1 Tax=Stegostoma tigrinum TaxID=3053191 RepID=UPI0028702CCD|nr:immunoglobulin superfamily member 11-like isoform X2 [Stegostoma tigrinum]